jgi:hypothetical protein
MQAPAPAAAQFEAEVPPAGAIGAPHRNPSSAAPAFAGSDSRHADMYFARDLTGSASALGAPRGAGHGDGIRTKRWARLHAFAAICS